jgi:uncharacterized hydrophobic protein (TIGR00271 family)
MIQTGSAASDAPDTCDRLRASIALSSQCDVPYLTMNVLATVIASYGLLENSPAVVIGAMLIAMLLGPISGVALGLVDGDDSLLRRALLSLLAGAAVVYLTAMALGALHGDLPLTAEIYARTSPNLMDLMIALCGGAAAAFAAISPRLNGAVVGVAIATALVPPLASSAICLVHGEYQLSAGAFLLAFANMVGIQAAGSVVMWVSGYRGPRRTGLFKRSAVSLAMLVVLAGLLTLNLRRMIAKESFEGAVRTSLQHGAVSQPGAYLVDVRFRRESARLIVTAVYRTPVPFSPAQVAVLEQSLPRDDGRNRVELRVRSIPITVASSGGYLYNVEDDAGSWPR